MGSCCLSVIKLCLNLCDSRDHRTPLSWWCHPTILASVAPFSFCLQSCSASGSFPSELALHNRRLKYWSFSFSISPCNWYSGLIFFRIDWFDLLAVQGTLKSLPLAPQFKSINSSVLSLLYGPTLTSMHDCWKNHSFDCADLCLQSDVSAFLICCLDLS